MKPSDLSNEAKQTFQIVSLIATILVVGIHYKSAAPISTDFNAADWNQLLQDFWFGGIARVAVPLFAFAAGLFYFRSDDGSWPCYVNKTKQRFFSVLVPYLIVGLAATLVWSGVQVVKGTGELTLLKFASTWLLHPPAIQLWFLRDLVLIVMAAPLIRWLGQSAASKIAIPAIGIAWFFNFQVFPIVGGWYLLNLEPLFFFVLGCAAVRHYAWIERLGAAKKFEVGVVVSVWCLLVSLRVLCRPDFDLWYTNRWGFLDLAMHQVSILVGCVGLFMICWRLRSQFALAISGGSFFVYLAHEFPLRAIVVKVIGLIVPEAFTCWIATPCVVVGCYLLAVVIQQWLPSVYKIVTGGRGPDLRFAGLPDQLKRPLGIAFPKSQQTRAS